MLYLIYEDETFWLHKRRKPRRSATNDQGQSYFICSIAFVDFFSCSSALLRFCVSTDRAVDYFSYFVCEEHFNILC